jgi:hypothetical protein
MGKVAKLVYVSLVTRVVVDENASEADILELAGVKLAEKIQNELTEHLESIEDDIECPYDHLYDEYPFFDTGDEDK